MKKTDNVILGIIIIISSISDLIFLSEMEGTWSYYLDSSLRMMVSIGKLFGIVGIVISVIIIISGLGKKDSDAKSNRPTNCPSCGAKVNATSNVCWRCRHRLDGKEEEITKSEPVKEEPVSKSGIDEIMENELNQKDETSGQIVEVYFIGLSEKTAKIKVIQAIRDTTGQGLADTKNFVENPPSLLAKNCPLEEGERIKQRIEEAGGKVEFRIAY